MMRAGGSGLIRRGSGFCGGLKAAHQEIGHMIAHSHNPVIAAIVVIART
jgi:hypothetical protein